MRIDGLKIDEQYINNRRTKLIYRFEPFIRNKKLFLYIRDIKSKTEDKFEINNIRFLEFLNQISCTYYHKYIHKDLFTIINWGDNEVLSNEKLRRINKEKIKNICKKYGDCEYKILEWFLGLYFLVCNDLNDYPNSYIKEIYCLRLNYLFVEKKTPEEIMKLTNLNTDVINLYILEKTYFQYENHILTEEYINNISYKSQYLVPLGETHIVNAIAGAGKTTWLKKLVCDLIHKGVPYYSILTLSFNKSITEHDKKELKKYTGYTIETKTIHSFCYWIIETYENKKINLLEDNKNLITQALFNLKMIINTDDDLIDKTILALSSYNNLLDKNNYDIDYFEIESSELDKINAEYMKLKIMRNVMDFDDLMQETLTLLKTHKYIVEDIICTYKYFCCDEFQDVNELQWAILSLFRTPKTNIYIVGDDNQSIYGFRGAQPQILVELAKEPGVIIKNLNKSYRCPKQVCAFAESVVSNNKNRLDKRVLSNKNYELDKNVTLHSLNSTNFLEEFIEYLNNNQLLFLNKEKTNVILCRTNKEIESLKELMTNKNPYLLTLFNISTIHKAKGLEFDKVIVLDWVFIAKSSLLYQNKNQIPNSILEEERRLFYVACTRTKENLYVFYRQNMKSIFIEESQTSFILTKKQLDIIKVFNDERNTKIFDMCRNMINLGYIEYEGNLRSVKGFEDDLLDMYQLNINLNFSKIIENRFKYFVFDLINNQKNISNKSIWTEINKLPFVENRYIRRISYFEVRCFKKQYEDESLL